MSDKIRKPEGASDEQWGKFLKGIADNTSHETLKRDGLLSSELEEKVIRYALVYLNANWEEVDAEDMEINELVLDGTLRRWIKQRTET